MAGRRIIGVDLDNTIVSYDRLMYSTALERGLITPETPLHKKAIRQAIRRSAAGEKGWQTLQGLVYGPLMSNARLIDGVGAFFIAGRQQALPMFIVSHKTRFATVDPTHTDLRQAALQWLARHHFFDPSGPGLTPADVFFESTRQAKIARIQQLDCSDFIDDLEELFLDPAFPPQIHKYLFSPTPGARLPADICVCTSWHQIYTRILDQA